MCIKVNFDGCCSIGNNIYPAIGFGTYPLKSHSCTAVVSEALQQGYHIIDTATYYENFESIAIATQDYKREDIYLISKVWHDSHTRGDVIQDLKKTLAELNISYLDAYLIHWPNSKIPIEETLSAMDELRCEGKVRDIGLCNVTVSHLKRALEVGVPISWIQVEMHAQYCDEALLSFCREKNIAVQAWRPLNLGRLCTDSLLTSIGVRYDKSASQVALRWIIQKGVLPLPGSSNPEHIAENLNVFDFSLTVEEMEQINKKAREGERMRLTLKNGLGFKDEFDFSYDQCWPKN